MEGCFMFQWVVVFQMGGASFLSGGHPMGGISFDGGGGFQKKTGWWGVSPMLPHYGKPCIGVGWGWAWGVPPHCMIFLKTLLPTLKNDPSS